MNMCLKQSISSNKQQLPKQKFSLSNAAARDLKEKKRYQINNMPKYSLNVPWQTLSLDIVSSEK